MADDYAPSAQIILSNERTFLAWIRTSLALVATGVALVAFDVPIPDTWARIAASIFVVLGIGAAVQAWLGWRATDAAARAGEPIPAPAIRVLLVSGIVVAIFIVVVGIAIG